jgi:hypothetical protein
MAEEQPGDRPGSVEDEAPGPEEGPSEAGTEAEGGEGDGDAAAAASVPGRRQRSFTTDWQALLTGMLIGAMMNVGGEFGVSVSVDTDPDGNYLPWFVVTSAAGNRAVVTVTAL